MVAVILLAAAGVAGWFLLSGDGDSASPKAAAWTVGSCVKQTAGPTSVPATTDPQKKAVLEGQRKFEPAGCGASDALSKIEALGAKVAAGAERPADDGCPDNTDEAYRVEGAAQILCARLLKGPHPGDPGGGGGNVVTGDCVIVLSTNSQRGANDQVAEDACATEHWAKVLATAQQATGCTAEGTLSRIPLPGKSEVVLCLGPSDKGAMPKPGDCADTTAEPKLPPLRADCGSKAGLWRFEGVADDAGKCTTGNTARTATGFDRKICGRANR